MKFINVIRPGDFVILKSLGELKQEYGEPKEYTSTGSLFFGEVDTNRDPKKFLHISKNTRKELGNVLRIKSVSNHKSGLEIYFTAENNGIEYDYEDSMEISFTERLIDAVQINGKWHLANDDINSLY